MTKQLTWAVALAALTVLAAFAQLCLRETQHERVLGLKTEARNGSVFVSYVLPAGPAWDSGIRPGYRLLEADGRPASQLGEAALNRARSVTYVRPSGAIGEGRGPTNLKKGLATRAPFLFIAAGFAILGGIVLILTDGSCLGWLFFAWTVATAIALTAPIGELSGASWTFVVEILALTGFGASTAGLFAMFPINRLARRSARLFLVLLELSHAALAASYAWVLLRDPGVYELIHEALNALLALDMVIAILSASSPLTISLARRQRVPVENLVLGTAVAGGLAPFVFFSMLPSVLGFGYLVSPSTAILSLVLLPLGIATTMGRAQLFGIKRWVRRGLIRLFTWGLLVMSYGLLLMVAGERVAATGDGTLKLLTSPFVIVLVIGLTLPRIQRSLGDRLESSLLQDVYSFPTAMQRLSQIAYLRTPNEVAESALAALGETLDLEWAALTLFANGADGLSASPSQASADSFTWGSCPPQLFSEQRHLESGNDGAGSVRPSTGATAVIPLTAAGTETGILVTGPKNHDLRLRPEDQGLLKTAAPLLAICFQLARQLELAAQGEVELHELSQRLVDVEEETRRTLALELHDDAVQRVILLSRELDDQRLALPLAGRWSEALTEVAIALRSICVGLYPTILEDLGLPAGLDQLVDELRVQTEISADVVVTTHDGQEFGRLDRDLELAFYRIAQEALNNVRKHSTARHVLVSLQRREAGIELIVADDGDSTERKDGQVASGLGISGMRHRLSRWDGTLALSDRDGRGTQVRAEAQLELARR